MKFAVLFFLSVSVCFAGGTFKRSVKIVDGYIADHRPVGHNLPGEWITVDVDNDGPALNDMMIGKFARVQDGKPKFDAGWKAKLANAKKPRKRIQRQAAIIRALKKKLAVTEAEIAAAKAELEQEAGNAE